MAIIGNTELGVTQNDLKTALVQNELRASSKMMPFLTDVSKFAVKGSKSISFPKLTSFTVENRTSGVAGTSQAITATNDQLDLNINAHVQWVTDANTAYQSAIDVESEFIKLASQAHGYDFDVKVLAGIKAAAGLLSTAGITAAKILTLREYITKNEGKLQDMVMVIAPDVETTMLGIADFIRADSYGAGVTALQSGEIGKVYGVKVVVHSALGAGNALMFEKRGYAYGLQRAPAYAAQSNIEYGVGAVLNVVGQLYGHKALQVQVNGAAAGKSPLIASLI
jgi:N4-gp56 family major capsid protein